MDLDPLEWASAEQLLLRLVHTLTPPSSQEEELEILGGPLLIMQKFFTPPKKVLPQTLRSRQPTRILEDLQETQKEMGEWIENLSKNSFTPSNRPFESRPLEPSSRSFPKKPTSLIPQAEKLLNQVRLAIQTLSTSSHLKQPKTEPLIQVMQKLKPLIDELITALASTEKGEITKPTPLKKKPHQFRAFSSAKEIPERFQPPFSHLAAPASGRKIKREQLKTESLLDQKDLSSMTKEKQQISSLRIEKMILPAAPYTPQIRLTTQNRKKKKRRFWLKDDPEDPSKDA